MENKIDQFFKDKIEGHSLPPSEKAWAKVEANLSKKNNVAIWRIAAAVLITGALISVIIWSQRGVEKNQPVIVAKKSQKDNTIKEKSSSQISQVEMKDDSKSLTKKSLITIPAPRSMSPQIENKSVQKSQENEMWSMKEQTTVEVKENKPSFAKASEDKEKIKQEATQ